MLVSPVLTKEHPRRAGMQDTAPTWYENFLILEMFGGHCQVQIDSEMTQHRSINGVLNGQHNISRPINQHWIN